MRHSRPARNTDGPFDGFEKRVGAPVSNDISKNHVVVCIEDLQVKNISKSATKKVAQKSGLNRAILDASPFELRRQLEYKTQWQGGLLVPVPPQNTSRKCPECGHVSAENRKSQAKFICVECEFLANADFVAAVNIREAGLASLACSQPSSDVKGVVSGTHRRYSRLAGVPVGIPSFQGGEDFKIISQTRARVA
jgi:putative transposase